MVLKKCYVVKSSENFNRHICIDESEEEDIADFISIPKHEKKFNYIANRILEQSFMYYEDYEQIEENVTCMRFFPNGINVRFYCKEVVLNNNIFCIVISKLVYKKSRGINKSIQSKIDALKTFNYEISEEE